MPEHPYGLLSLLPPVVAIVLAIATRRVFISLLAGIFAGAIVLAGGDPTATLSIALEKHLWASLVDTDRLHVFAFTCLMGAMVGVVTRNGGMRGLVDSVSVWAKNRRRAQVVTWLLGLLIFFDDYANTVLLGNTVRPLTDRLKISREKLAYLVDSTAAPVAGLAIVSTWVASEIDFVRSGIAKLPIEADDSLAFNLFVQSIPYRFYVLLALVFVFLIAVLSRDFGPMWRAERNCLDKDDEITDSKSETDESTGRWYHAVLPVFVTVAVIVWFLYSTGRSELAAVESPSLMQVFGNSDAYGSLLWGALAGLLVAALMSQLQRLLTGPEIVDAAASGARLMVPSLIILWLASSMSVMTGSDPDVDDKSKQARADNIAGGLAKLAATDEEIQKVLSKSDVGEADIAVALAELRGTEQLQADADQFTYRYSGYRLYTGDYLGGVLNDRLPAWSLPTLVFVLSSLIAFSTGTSWGTMGIVMPLTIPLVYGVLTSNGLSTSAETHHIMFASVGSVLAGAIFGDHCSPISDTTVLSSQASGCDHVAHVWTQLPYALLVGGVAIVFGTLPVGLGIPVWILLPTAVAFLIAFLFMFGRRVDE